MILSRVFKLFFSVLIGVQFAFADSQSNLGAARRQALQSPDYYWHFDDNVAKVLLSSPPNSEMIIFSGGRAYSVIYLGTEMYQGERVLVFNGTLDIGPAPEGFNKSEVVVSRVGSQSLLSGKDAASNNQSVSSGQSSVSTSDGEASTSGKLNSNSHASSLSKGIQAGLQKVLIGAFFDKVVVPVELKNTITDIGAEVRDLVASNQEASAINDRLFSDIVIKQAVVLNDLANSRGLIEAQKATLDSLAAIAEGRRGNDLNRAQISDVVRELKSYTQVRPDFKHKIGNLSKRITDIDPRSLDQVKGNYRNLSERLALSAVQSEVMGDFELSDSILKFAEKALDVVVGLDPFTGIARDIFEVSTGKNLITGEDLSSLELGVSVVSLAASAVSFGMASSLSHGIKAGLSLVGKTKSGSLLAAKSIQASEQIKNVVSVLAEHRVSLQNSGGKLFRKLKEVAKSSAGNIQDFSKGLRAKIGAGEISTLSRLSREIVENPASLKAIERMNQIAIDIKNINILPHHFKPGGSKLVLIGRDMKNRIIPFAERLKREGFDVEVFDADLMGKWGKEVPYSAEDVSDLLEAGNKLSYREIQSTSMYMKNRDFILKAKDHGATILNLDYNSRLGESAFFDMERFEVGFEVIQ